MDQELKIVEVLHIGGIAEGLTIGLPDQVLSVRYSFKPDGSGPEAALHHHEYTRKAYLVEQMYPHPQLPVQVMVLNEVPESVATVLIGAHLGGGTVPDLSEAD